MAEPKFIAGIRVHICYLDRKCGRIALSHCNNGRDADDPAGIVVPWTRKALLIEGGLPRFQISWKTPEQPDFTEIDWGDNTIPRWQDEKYMAPSDEEQTVTVWIADIIDRFRIYPDKPLFPSSQTQDNSDPSGFQPFDFVISKIELLVEQD